MKCLAYVHCLAALLAVCVLCPTVVGGPSSASFDLTWNSIDGGAAETSTSTSFSLRGTIGQCDATSAAALASPSFAATGGFWHSSLGVLACVVDADDLAAFALDWLAATPASADLNGDTYVNLGDFAVLAHYWLIDCPPGWPW